MITCYAAPREHTSPRFARAFGRGFGAAVETFGELKEGDVAMFGSPQRWELLQRAIAQGRTWYYGDHAYFGRRQYYRITRRAFQHDAQGTASPARFDHFGIPVKPWRRSGGHVLVCPNSPAFFALHGRSADVWTAGVIDTLKQHTDRPVRVRFKDSPGDLEGDLRDAWACVVYVSVCGVHAALAGVPTIATDPCASRSFGSGNLASIEAPVMPDNRFEMACVLAANQWTLGEISSGQARSILS